jgi:NAD(P)-dependent dehydrogenase (short-subunit alcohol dehydrogenase family)
MKVDTKKSQKVFITGTDKGLGFSLVSRFLRAGWQVFAGVYMTTENLQVLEQEFDTRLVSVPLDVANVESIAAARNQITAQIQALDILINNAAVYLPPKPIRSLAELDLTDGHLEASVNVNSFGPLRVTQQFLPLLDKGTRKLIINISSEAGSIGNCRRTSEFAYCMSKAALNIQSRILQNALTSQGFQVLAIHPGWMRTDMGGPEADIDPSEAAGRIFELALKPRSTGEPMYIDYQGNPLPW